MRTGGYRVTRVAVAAAGGPSSRRALEVRIALEGPEAGSTVTGSAAVPLGAQADGDAVMTQAVMTQRVATLLAGRRWRSFDELDRALGTLAATAARESRDARVTLGASVAAARAFAAADGVALHRWLPHPAPACLPMPHLDLVHGGRHAPGRVDFARFGIVPVAAPSVREALRAGAAVHGRFRVALERLGLRTAPGDDGIFLPALQAPGDVLDLLCDAIADAGYERGRRGVAITLDVAAGRLREPDGAYRVNGAYLDSVDMVEYLAHLVDRYRVVSIQDAMAPDDAKGWRLLAERVADAAQLVTSLGLAASTSVGAATVARHGGAVALELGAARTVTEILAAVRHWYGRGAKVVVSQRTGWADDPFGADLAVAVGCGQIDAGPVLVVERSPAYDRLAALEAAADPTTGSAARDVAGTGRESLPYARGGQ